MTISYGYICAVCSDPITDGDPHSTPDGDDCHAECCEICANDNERDNDD